MNPKVNLWAMLTSLGAIVSIVAAVPAHAVSVPTESVGERVVKIRAAMAQPQIGQSAGAQNPNANSTLISQWNNVTGSGWTNTPSWNNWNNGSSSPSWGNGWGNWENI